MKRKTLWSVFICLVLLSGMLAGCNRSTEAKETGLKVYNWSTSLGAVDNSLDKTKLSYSIDITNKNAKDAYIRAVELNIGEKIRTRIIEGNTTLEINKALQKDQSIQISGNLIIDTKGMDKNGITGLEPFITGIKVTTEEVINIDYK